MNERSNHYNEITLSIALLGGIIVIFLKVIDYCNNHSLEFDSNLKPLIYVLVGFLLIELLLILLFFIFKGISAHVGEPRQKELETITRDLFMLSLIIAFAWFIASALTLFVKSRGLEGVWSLYGALGYILIIIATIVIIKNIFLTEIRDLKTVMILIGKIKNSRTYLKIITILFLFILVIDIFYLAPQYLLTGSYSIEEFSPSIDNPDILTFTMKEKGIYYNSTEVYLFKLNSSKTSISNDNLTDNIDHIIGYRSIERKKEKNSCYLSVTNFNTVWYLNIINISNLSSGTYLLLASVYDNKNNYEFSESKRVADKLFYIPPGTAKANYSNKCEQTS